MRIRYKEEYPPYTYGTILVTSGNSYHMVINGLDSDCLYFLDLGDYKIFHYQSINEYSEDFQIREVYFPRCYTLVLGEKDEYLDY